MMPHTKPLLKKRKVGALRDILNEMGPDPTDLTKLKLIDAILLKQQQNAGPVSQSVPLEVVHAEILNQESDDDSSEEITFSDDDSITTTNTKRDNFQSSILSNLSKRAVKRLKLDIINNLKPVLIKYGLHQSMEKHTISNNNLSLTLMQTFTIVGDLSSEDDKEREVRRLAFNQLHEKAKCSPDDFEKDVTFITKKGKKNIRVRGTIMGVKENASKNVVRVDFTGKNGETETRHFPRDMLKDYEEGDEGEIQKGIVTTPSPFLEDDDDDDDDELPSNSTPNPKLNVRIRCRVVCDKRGQQSVKLPKASMATKVSFRDEKNPFADGENDWKVKEGECARSEIHFYSKTFAQLPFPQTGDELKNYCREKAGSTNDLVAYEMVVVDTMVAENNLLRWTEEGEAVW